jgi:hypothetical protein
MELDTLETWSSSKSGSSSIPRHWLLTPPYGYVLGVGLWPVFAVLVSLWTVLIQAGIPSVAVTTGGLIVVFGGFIATFLSSATVLCLTAWNVSSTRLRQQFVLASVFLGLAVLLFSLFGNWPTIPYRMELGLSAFAAHELSKIVFAGPALGCTFGAVCLFVVSTVRQTSSIEQETA